MLTDEDLDMLDPRKRHRVLNSRKAAMLDLVDRILNLTSCEPVWIPSYFPIYKSPTRS